MRFFIIFSCRIIRLVIIHTFQFGSIKVRLGVSLTLNSDIKIDNTMITKNSNRFSIAMSDLEGDFTATSSTNIIDEGFIRVDFEHTPNLGRLSATTGAGRRCQPNSIAQIIGGRYVKNSAEI